MKIEKIDIDGVRVRKGSSWVFVQIHTEEELVGLGELNPSAPREECISELRRMGTYALGKDPRHTEAFVAGLEPAALGRCGVHALAAFEQALWDILGQSLGVPVYQLLGGKCRDEQRLYANITRATDGLEPEGFVKSAKGALADGFDAVKIAPFALGENAGERAANIERGIECARAVRAAIGAEVDLLLDCYGIYRVDEGMRIARAMEEVGLFWLEEPVGDDDIAGYQKMRAESGFTIAGGERMQLRQGFWTMLERQMMDIIMPDVTIVGGIGELKKVAALAEARGIAVSPHGPFSPVTVVTGLQAIGAHPQCPILEYAWREVPWRERLVIPQEKVVDSRMRLPEGPGLGVRLNMDVVEEQRLGERVTIE